MSVCFMLCYRTNPAQIKHCMTSAFLLIFQQTIQRRVIYLSAIPFNLTGETTSFQPECNLTSQFPNALPDLSTGKNKPRAPIGEQELLAVSFSGMWKVRPTGKQLL